MGLLGLVVQLHQSWVHDIRSSITTVTKLIYRVYVQVIEDRPSRESLYMILQRAEGGDSFCGMVQLANPELLGVHIRLDLLSTWSPRLLNEFHVLH